MNSIMSDLGTNVLAQLIEVANGFSFTRLAPSTITYHAGRVLAGGNDTGFTEDWTTDSEITASLVGHYRVETIEASGGQIEASDILAIFAISELSAEPQGGDVIEWNSKVYEYVDHQAAAGLYAVRMAERDAINEA